MIPMVLSVALGRRSVTVAPGRTRRPAAFMRPNLDGF
jgi:hypothetical protein